jgi:hypothetical protein
MMAIIVDEDGFHLSGRQFGTSLLLFLENHHPAAKWNQMGQIRQLTRPFLIGSGKTNGTVRREIFKIDQ